MAFKFKDLTVLLADDDVSIREITSAILKRLEFNLVDIAKNGEEALELFCKHNHSVIITDWQMDPMDGIELIRTIRSKEAPSPNRKVPIILATGYTNMKMIEEARNAGATELLVKPYSADDLAKRITYVLNKPRKFIDCNAYSGPDRRRLQKRGFNGPFKRKEDSNSDR